MTAMIMLLPELTPTKRARLKNLKRCHRIVALFLLVILFNRFRLSIRERARGEDCATEHSRTEVAYAADGFPVPR
jgi:hypothetical protein